MEKTKVYKIRNKTTGLFSSGGTHPTWSKNGKTWSNIGHVKNHIRLFFDFRGFKSRHFPYDDAELIEVEIDYKECDKIDINDLFLNK